MNNNCKPFDRFMFFLIITLDSVPLVPYNNRSQNLDIINV